MDRDRGPYYSSSSSLVPSATHPLSPSDVFSASGQSRAPPASSPPPPFSPRSASSGATPPSSTPTPDTPAPSFAPSSDTPSQPPAQPTAPPCFAIAPCSPQSASLRILPAPRRHQSHCSSSASDHHSHLLRPSSSPFSLFIFSIPPSTSLPPVPPITANTHSGIIFRSLSSPASTQEPATSSMRKHRQPSALFIFFSNSPPPLQIPAIHFSSDPPHRVPDHQHLHLLRRPPEHLHRPPLPSSPLPLPAPSSSSFPSASPPPSSPRPPSSFSSSFCSANLNLVSGDVSVFSLHLPYASTATLQLQVATAPSPASTCSVSVPATGSHYRQ